jgi:excisionase family DNA binding protein
MSEATGRDPDILSTEELASRIGLSAPTVRRAVSRGEIPGLRIGKDWRFSYSAVIASIRSYHPVEELPADSEEQTAAQLAALDHPHDIRGGVPRRSPRQSSPQSEPSGSKTEGRVPDGADEHR